jgi:hypothetical protein
MRNCNKAILSRLTGFNTIKEGGAQKLDSTTLGSPSLNQLHRVGLGIEETEAKAYHENTTEVRSNYELSFCKLCKLLLFHLVPSGCDKLTTTLIKCICKPAASHSMSDLTSESFCPLTYRDSASSN